MNCCYHLLHLCDLLSCCIAVISMAYLLGGIGVAVPCLFVIVWNSSFFVVWFFHGYLLDVYGRVDGLPSSLCTVY